MALTHDISSLVLTQSSITIYFVMNGVPSLGMI